jgi:signal peptidase II
LSTTGVDRPDVTGEVRPEESGRPGRRIGLMFAIALLVVVTDQVTKSLAVSRLSAGPIHLIGPFAFALAYNTGVAFSIGSGLTVPIVLIVLVVVAVVAWFGRTVRNNVAAIGVGMILGGAIGNLADRLFRGHHGAVVDFIYSGFWPTFNLADASIVCGCVVLGLVFWRTTATKRPPDGPGKDAQ